MCNLCSGRLFLVPNPCCCCDLRCGVIWTGFGDIIGGIVSYLFPITRNVDFNILELEDGDTSNIDPDAPVFDVEVSDVFRPKPPFDFIKIKVKNCYVMQVVSGVMIICAAYGMGSHNFSRFLLACTWLFLRFIIVVVLTQLIPEWLKSEHGPLKRYGIFASFHVIVDVYLIIVVRYYAMECYDSFRYKKMIDSVRIRRDPPTASKSAPKTRSGKSKQKGSRKVQVAPEKKLSETRDFFQKKRHEPEEDIERVPVWDRKNEVIFYGEDYTDWDPAVFLARWEMLNEMEKEEQAKTKLKPPTGFALAMLKSQAVNKGVELKGKTGTQNDEADPTKAQKDRKTMSDTAGVGIGGSPRTEEIFRNKKHIISHPGLGNPRGAK